MLVDTKSPGNADGSWKTKQNVNKAYQGIVHKVHPTLKSRVYMQLRDQEMYEMFEVIDRIIFLN